MNSRRWATSSGTSTSASSRKTSLKAAPTWPCSKASGSTWRASATPQQRKFRRHGLSVLDPTCGSGAFLFAALSIRNRCTTPPAHPASRAGDALMTGDTSHLRIKAEVDELLLLCRRWLRPRAGLCGHQTSSSSTTSTAWTLRNSHRNRQAAPLPQAGGAAEPGDYIEPLPDIDFQHPPRQHPGGHAAADRDRKAVKGATQGNLFSDAWEDIRIRLVAVGNN